MIVESDSADNSKQVKAVKRKRGKRGKRNNEILEVGADQVQIKFDDKSVGQSDDLKTFAYLESLNNVHIDKHREL